MDSRFKPNDEAPVGPDCSELKSSSLSSTASISQYTDSQVKRAFRNLTGCTQNIDTYSESTLKYINEVKANTVNLSHLNLISDNELSDCRDFFTLKIACIPVLLNNYLYDLQTLLDRPVYNGYRKDPLTDTEFCLLDIEPAKDKYLRIQQVLTIKKQQQENEEKYSSQAAVFIASAERERERLRPKCSIL